MLHRHTADLDYSIEQQNRTLGRLRILTDKKTNRSIPLFARMLYRFVEFNSRSHDDDYSMSDIEFCETPSAHMSVSVSILLSICDISY